MSANTLIQIENIPSELRMLPNWVLHRAAHGNKCPLQPSGAAADSSDPLTWSSFAEVMMAISRFDGIGFVLTGTPYAGIDLDKIRNAETGEILFPWVNQLVMDVNSYTELSPSETGIHVLVRGSVPKGVNKKHIELYSEGRYFTMTGRFSQSISTQIETRDLLPLYNRVLSGEFDTDEEKSEAAKKSASGLSRDVIDLANTDPIPDGTRNDTLTRIAGKYAYEKGVASEAELYDYLRDQNQSRCTPPLPDGEVRTIANSIFSRNHKTREDETPLIGGAVAGTNPVPQKSAMPFDTEAYKQVIAASVGSGADSIEDEIPPFDPSVINGIYRDFVELATRGTTMSPQFAFVIAKTILGLRMAGHVRFETLDAEPRYYTALIGETGSGKGEAWRRVLQIIRPGSVVDGCRLKVINSMDSGAGLKDLFFEIPDYPVLCYVDEVIGLGNKAKATKNPEILDTIIELANSTSISRTLAKKGKSGGSKTKNDARLAVVMCGQDGEVYTEAFAGRTKMGLWDRLYPEFGAPVEAGDLPPVPMDDAIKLLSKFNCLDFNGEIAMSDAARTVLDDFWKAQPREVRTKARFRTNLLLDAYMSAFGRGSRVVEPEDAEIAVKIFVRQLVIRRVHFKTEIPDAIGKYTARLKAITERMLRQIVDGIEPESVAKSRRDFERETHSYRDNEGHVFSRAWETFSKVYLQPVTVEKRNGLRYTKYVPAVED